MDFRDWLASLDADRLARVLETRRDVIKPPWPRRLDGLAKRLADPYALMWVRRKLPRPLIEILAAAQVLGARATRARLADFLGTTEQILRPFVERLEDNALAWSAGERVHISVHVQVHAALGLGLPAAELLMAERTVRDLRQMSSLLRPDDSPGVTGTKRDLVGQIVDFYQDHERMDAMLGSAPEGTRKLLAEFAWEGPLKQADYHGAPRDTPGRWAVDRGLLWRYDWFHTHMPREVALTLRGPDYRAPFTPRPPDLPTIRVAKEVIEHDASAAAVRTLDRVAALLDNAAKTRLPLLKNGGVGVREVRRLAKELGCTEDETRLYLEIAAVARLLAWGKDIDGLAPTERFDDWRMQDPATRLRVLLAAWWRMERCSLMVEAGKRPAALGDWRSGAAFQSLRHQLIGVLAGVGEESGCTDLDALVAAAEWQAPLSVSDGLEPAWPAVLAEAALLGLYAGGSLSAVGRALAALAAVAGGERDGEAPEVTDDPTLVAGTEAALKGTRDHALFGADLTAVVTGPPSTDLAALLDLAADRESQGAATVWRFGPATVRRALDTGRSAGALLDDLAAAGVLPQPLVYLIKDVARRHGEIGVMAVACCVTADDPALLTEIAAHRKLVRLSLQKIAPTVLVTSVSPAQVLTTLREAGYAPMPVEPDGTVAVERAARRALLQPVGGRVVRPIEEPDGPSPSELARRIQAAGAAGDPQPWTTIARTAGHLKHGERALLGAVAQHGLMARIGCTDGRSYTVSSGEVHDGVIEAWCHEAGDYRRFPLREIVAVENFHG